MRKFFAKIHDFEQKKKHPLYVDIYLKNKKEQPEWQATIYIDFFQEILDKDAYEILIDGKEIELYLKSSL